MMQEEENLKLLEREILGEILVVLDWKFLLL
jgi:hypothetical protein